jgi:hypothetical protein
MPAHIGIADRLKIPLASLVKKGMQLRYAFDKDNIRRPSDSSMKAVADRLEEIRTRRERPFTSYDSFRQIVDLYKPDEKSSAEVNHDWKMNIGPDGYIDQLVKLSFELDTITKGVLISRKSVTELKRLEVYRSDGSMEIAWSHG